MPIISTRPAKPGSVNVALTRTIKAMVNNKLAIKAKQATMPAKR